MAQAIMDGADLRPLVMHVVHRFDTGGLENGVVNLINHMPVHAYRHAVLALTEITEFKSRIHRDDVQFIALHKPPGHGFRLYPRLFRLMRQLRPAIVHTRNLAALEVALPAWAAGVPVRVHGEHGRDVGDLDGSSRRHQWMRRVYRPFITRYIALSKDLARYLTGKVGVAERRVAQIYNGVDIVRFVGTTGNDRPAIAGCPFSGPGMWMLGTVGRMVEVKDQLNLSRAFIIAMQRRPELQARVRLVMVGEGPVRAQAQQMLDGAGFGALCWLPGERSDVAEVMQGFSCFVLPSLAEGISNTILEAMATGLPVIATDVGGNAELVTSGQTGSIVPAANPEALAEAILSMAQDPGAANRMGAAGRADVERRFSLQSMVESYQALYDQLVDRARPVEQEV